MSAAVRRSTVRTAATLRALAVSQHSESSRLWRAFCVGTPVTALRFAHHTEDWASPWHIRA